MKRQLIIRGAAIAFAGVAASVFAAQQFLNLGAAGDNLASAPGGNSAVVGASLVGGGGSAAAPEPAAPAALAQDMGSLQLRADQPAAAPGEVPAQVDVAALNDGMPPEQSALPSGDFQPPLTLAQASNRADDASCAPTLEVTAAIDALVDLRLNAPCAANQRVVVSHDELAFSTFTDANGELAIYVPALTQIAAFEVFLEDQSVLSAQTAVPEVAEHVRMMVQWQGSDFVALHAFHRGAAYGESGHIHASRPFDPATDQAFVLSLGTARGPEPMLAQVYSIPVGLVDVARTEIEVSVNPQTCGRDVSAFVSQKWSGQTGVLEELSLAMPECGTGAGVAVLPVALRNPAVSQANALTPVSMGQN